MKFLLSYPINQQKSSALGNWYVITYICLLVEVLLIIRGLNATGAQEYGADVKKSIHVQLQMYNKIYNAFTCL